MLKVKVEPVEPTLYGKLPLPANPLSIEGYQVFCSNEESQDIKDNTAMVENSAEMEEGEVILEGSTAMMPAQCCDSGEHLSSGVGNSKTETDELQHIKLGMNEFVENDVMVDNSLVEEQVVDDSMVLVSPDVQDPHDTIQVPYMETAPAEVLVIEEGAELMVENIHGIGAEMIMDGNREYLMGHDSNVMVPSMEGQEGGQNVPVESDVGKIDKCKQPGHVVVERINYELPVIQTSDDSEYFLPEEPDPAEEPMHGSPEIPAVESPNRQETSIGKHVRLVKGKKSPKKETKVSENVTRKKKTNKRRVEEGTTCGSLLHAPQGGSSKSKKKQKACTADTSAPKISAPKLGQVLIANKSENLSAIQAKHPTLSSLLSGKVLPAAPLLNGSFGGDPPIIPKPSLPTHIITPNWSSLQPVPVQLIRGSPVLPQIVTDINESSQSPSQLESPTPDVKKSDKNNRAVPLVIKRTVRNVEHHLTPNVPLLTTALLMESHNFPPVSVNSESDKATYSSTAASPSEGSYDIEGSSSTQMDDNVTAPAVTSPTAGTAVKSSSVLSVAKLVQGVELTASSPGEACITEPGSAVVSCLPESVVPKVSLPMAPVTTPLTVTISPPPLDGIGTPPLSAESELVVSPIQKKHKTVTSTLQARLSTKPVAPQDNAVSKSETLADRYMKEWKPTGRFQCRLCFYSCVTHNFLFRHWVLNHCTLRPFMCGHCGFQSATRDGVTRHQTAKHRGQSRRIFIDNDQQELLWNKFEEMFQGSGFVTELEREAQASYSMSGVSAAPTAQTLRIMNTGVKGNNNNAHEVVAGTILKVPKREKVSSKSNKFTVATPKEEEEEQEQEEAEETAMEDAKFIQDGEEDTVPVTGEEHHIRHQVEDTENVWAKGHQIESSDTDLESNIPALHAYMHSEKVQNDKTQILPCTLTVRKREYFEEAAHASDKLTEGLNSDKVSMVSLSAAPVIVVARHDGKAALSTTTTTAVSLSLQGRSGGDQEAQLGHVCEANE